MERVILVDPFDTAIGTAEKMAAQREGALHRAFSVVVFDSCDRLLLQRRAPGKYHSGGLWSNTCCGHPRPGEATQAAATRRLHEEMGFACELERSHALRYRTEFAGGLIENEFDHVLVGRCDAEPRPDPSEVSAWRWVEAPALCDEMERCPERFTYWFRLGLEEILMRAQSVLGPAGQPTDRVMARMPSPP